MKLIKCFAFMVVLLPTIVHSQWVDPITNSVWHYTNNLLVVDHSTLDSAQYDPRDVFGGQFGTIPGEVGKIVFQDGTPGGTTNWIEWSLASEPQAIRSVALHLAHDLGSDGGIQKRGLSRVRIMARDIVGDTNYLTLVDYSISGTHYNPLMLGNISTGIYQAVFAVPPTIKPYFRAELIQPLISTPGHEGARIIELAAFTNTIPYQPAFDFVYNDESNLVIQCSSLTIDAETRLESDTSLFSTQWVNVVKTSTNMSGYRLIITNATPGIQFYRLLSTPIK